MRNIKIIFVWIVSIVLFIIFNALEFEPLNKGVDKSFQSLIFSMTFALTTLKPKFRIKAFFFSLLLFSIIVGLYVFKNIELANSIASIMIGIFLITSVSYLPELIQKGYVEKL